MKVIKGKYNEIKNKALIGELWSVIIKVESQNALKFDIISK